MKYNEILRPSFKNCCCLVQTTSGGRNFFSCARTGSEQNTLADSADPDQNIPE